ncbi:hypothetical protein Aperf_G00000112888 [Anoplocephala perfoliata]
MCLLPTLLSTASTPLPPAPPSPIAVSAYIHPPPSVAAAAVAEAERNNGTNYPMGIDRAASMREHHYQTERETLSALEVSGGSPSPPRPPDRPPPRSAGQYVRASTQLCSPLLQYHCHLPPCAVSGECTHPSPPTTAAAAVGERERNKATSYPMGMDRAQPADRGTKCAPSSRASLVSPARPPSGPPALWPARPRVRHTSLVLSGECTHPSPPTTAAAAVGERERNKATSYPMPALLHAECSCSSIVFSFLPPLFSPLTIAVSLVVPECPLHLPRLANVKQVENGGSVEFFSNERGTKPDSNNMFEESNWQKRRYR